MKYIKLIVLGAILILATGGIEHGQPHIYDGTAPHIHSNGVIHLH